MEVTCAVGILRCLKKPKEAHYATLLWYDHCECTCLINIWDMIISSMGEIGQKQTKKSPWFRT